MFDRMIAAGPEANEPSYFILIYNAAIAEDKKALDQLLLETSLDCLNTAGITPIAQLAAEGNKKAINFLRQHYDLSSLGLLEGYGRSNDTKEIVEELAKLSKTNNSDLKQNAINGLIGGLAYGKHTNELDIYIAALSLQNISDDFLLSAKRNKILGFAANNYTEIVFKMLAEEADVNIKFILQQNAISGFGYAGNLDAIENIIDSTIDNKFILYKFGIVCLALANHLVKLDKLINKVDVSQHQDLFINVIYNFAQSLLLNNVKIMLEEADDYREQLFGSAVISFLDRHYFGPAKNLLALARNSSERRIVLKNLMQYIITGNRRLDQLPIIISNVVDAEEEKYLINVVIDLKLKNGLSEDVEQLRIIPPYNQYLDIILNKLMVYYAENKALEQITSLLVSNTNSPGNQNLINNMLWGYLKGIHLDEIKSYVNTIKDPKQKLVLFNLLVDYTLQMDSHVNNVTKLTDVSDDIADKIAIGTEILIRAFKLGDYDFAFAFLETVKLESLQVSLCEYYVLVCARINNTPEIERILNAVVNPTYRTTLLTAMVRGYIDRKHFAEAIAACHHLKDLTERTAMRAVLVTRISKAHDIIFLTQALSQADTPAELQKLIEKSINRNEFYAGPCFADSDKAVRSLALINSMTIRNAIAKELQTHKKNHPGYQAATLLTKADSLNTLVTKIAYQIASIHRFYKAKATTQMPKSEETISEEKTLRL
jgi:hypothetical protein